MKVIRQQWFGVKRPVRFAVIPLGDVHLGNSATDEKLFQSAVNRIAGDERCYWIGLGDYCEFINRTDPRFDPESIAPWLRMEHLGDLAKAQRDRFLDIVEPIAGKCLGLIEGNHERTIKKYYERDIYSGIVSGIKERGGFDADQPLALGVCGWLVWSFYMGAETEPRTRGRAIKVSLHHGFVGGKLAGAKALNMQRWLWNHDCDLAIFGHSHNSHVQVEAVEAVAGKRVVHRHRIGCYSGTFMSGAQYAVERGYFPTPRTYPEIRLRPWADHSRDRIQVLTST